MTVAATGALGARRALASGDAPHKRELSPETHAVLVDLTECVGCRLCEYACKKAHDVDPGAIESYEDHSVFETKRRPSPIDLTVINQWQPAQSDAKPLFTKVNCLHCNHAACVSACIVGALEKRPDGSVVYDPWKCIGCRYCMVACPFQIPTYEYDNVLTPQVRKCDFCATRTQRGEVPACVKECPRQVMTFGKRDQLLAMAHKRIEAHPDRYLNQVYGEEEAGGTSWLYLSNRPFEQTGFVKVGTDAPPALTESIQHGVFKYWAAPVAIYGFLASMFWYTGRRAQLATAVGETIDVELDQPDTKTLSYTHQKHVAQPLPLEEHITAERAKAKLLTPGVWFLISMVLVGVVAGLYRFIFGLQAATNLDQQHPWGLWIAMDVGSGIALAGGGFVTAALVHIFHREHYHAVARSALLTALLGYTFYVPGLLADIGRWYNIWHPMLPSMWQGNSALFEVGMCVMIYLTVQYIELTPIVCEAIGLNDRWTAKVKGWAKMVHDALEKIMPALLVLGVTLSCFHQSSLGNLMVIAQYKMHPLWWSPIAPLHFLLSAMMVGFPMVIFTMIFAAWSLNRKPDMDVLTPLSRYVPLFLAIYLATKIGDLAVRGTYTYLTDGSFRSLSWMVEIVGGVIVPMVMLLMPAVRRNSTKLATACLMVILGVVLNRLNVFLVAFDPPFAQRTYFPSVVELGLSIGLVAALMLTYRVAVTYLPVLEPEHPAEGKKS